MLDYYRREDININDVSQINLAFVGDAVYDVYIRTKLLLENPRIKTAELSKLKSDYVNAKSQSDIALYLSEYLSELERVIFKRGRNAKSKSAPRGRSIAEYRNATGFEALLGHLYLSKEEERLIEIMSLSYDYMHKKLMENNDVREEE